MIADQYLITAEQLYTASTLASLIRLGADNINKLRGKNIENILRVIRHTQGMEATKREVEPTPSQQLSRQFEKQAREVKEKYGFASSHVDTLQAEVDQLTSNCETYAKVLESRDGTIDCLNGHLNAATSREKDASDELKGLAMKLEIQKGLTRASVKQSEDLALALQSCKLHLAGQSPTEAAASRNLPGSEASINAAYALDDLRSRLDISERRCVELEEGNKVLRVQYDERTVRLEKQHCALVSELNARVTVGETHHRILKKRADKLQLKLKEAREDLREDGEMFGRLQYNLNVLLDSLCNVGVPLLDRTVRPDVNHDVAISQCGQEIERVERLIEALRGAERVNLKFDGVAEVDVAEIENTLLGIFGKEPQS